MDGKVFCICRHCDLDLLPFAWSLVGFEHIEGWRILRCCRVHDFVCLSRDILVYLLQIERHFGASLYCRRDKIVVVVRLCAIHTNVCIPCYEALVPAVGHEVRGRLLVKIEFFRTPYLECLVIVLIVEVREVAEFAAAELIAVISNPFAEVRYSKRIVVFHSVYRCLIGFRQDWSRPCEVRIVTLLFRFQIGYTRKAWSLHVSVYISRRVIVDILILIIYHLSHELYRLSCCWCINVGMKFQCLGLAWFYLIAINGADNLAVLLQHYGVVLCTLGSSVRVRHRESAVVVDVCILRSRESCHSQVIVLLFVKVNIVHIIAHPIVVGVSS